MCVSGARTNVRKLFVVGNALLIQAFAANFLLVRHFKVPENIGDSMTGLLFGAAIGCLLSFLIASRRG